MDPNYIDSDDDAEAQEMAAAMGFTGFGKPAAKKRKFNPSSDAFTEGDDLAKLDKGGQKGQGSGGNTMPLGKSRVFGTIAPDVEEKVPELEKKKGGNVDEIDLEDDDGEVAGPNYIDTSLPPPTEGAKPQYMVTTQSLAVESEGLPGANTDQPTVSESEAREVQSRIDALLASLQPAGASTSLPAPPTMSLGGPIAQQLPQRPVHNDTSFMQGGPRRGGSSVGSRSTHSHQHNEFWYVDYFDPSFLANPWEALEKQNGLEPLGSWPEHVSQHSRR